MVVGGSAASNPQASIGLAGSNNGSNLHVARNLYTYEDRVTWTRGRHQMSFGAWFQQFQSNENIALSQFGQATFTSLTTFLAGTASSFLFDPAPTPLNWRSLFGALHAEDVIRVSSKLTVSLGFRGEFSTGWNEAHGRASDYVFVNGVIQTQPNIGNNLFTTNNAKFLPQPRVGVAWSPLDRKTVLRAGFGMYNDLQDALGYRADQNAPFNPVYTIPNEPVASLPLNPAAPVPANAKLVPGGVQPDMKTPTLISWSTRIERETFAEHFSDGRLRRIARLSRIDWTGCERTVPNDLSRQRRAPRCIPRIFRWELLERPCQPDHFLFPRERRMQIRRWRKLGRGFRSAQVRTTRCKWICAGDSVTA